MLRRLATVILSVIALLGVAAISLVSLRIPAATWLAERQLARFGVAGAAFTVESIGYDRARLTDLRLGHEGEIEAAELRVRYRISELLSKPIESLHLEAPVIRLDLTGNAPVLGSLQGPAEDLLNKPGAGSAKKSEAPRITVEGGRVEALTSAGHVRLNLDGTVMPEAGATAALDFNLSLSGPEIVAAGHFLAKLGADGRTTGQLSVPDVSLADLDLGPGQIDFDVSETGAALQGKLGGEAGIVDLSVQAELNNDPAQPEIEAQIQLDSSQPGLLWRLTSLPGIDGGSGHMTLSMNGRLPPVADITSSSEAGASWWAASDLSTEIELALEEVAVPGWAQKVTALLPLEAGLSDGGLQLSLSREARMEASGLAYARLAALGVPEQLAGNQLRLSLPADGPIPFAARFTTRTDASTLSLGGTVKLSTATGVQLAAAGPARLMLNKAFQPDSLSFDDLSVTAESPSLAGIALPALSFSGHFAGDISLAVPAPAAAAEDSAVQSSIALNDGQVTLPDLHLRLDGLSAETALSNAMEPRELRFSAAAFSDLRDPPRFSPFSGAGILREDGETVSLSADLTGPDGTGKIDVTGENLLDDDRRAFFASLNPLLFAPGGAQPAAFSPKLKDLQDVTGTAEAKATLAWAPGGRQEQAQIRLQNLSFRSEGVEVRGLNLTLRLNGFLPLSSPPGQELTANQVDPGVPFENLVVRYRLLPGDPVKLFIEQADFQMAGGRYRVSEAEIDLSTPQQEFNLEVIDLNITSLLDKLQIEGLSGSGHLQGAVPVTIGQGNVSIEDARLSSRAPGVLRYRSATAAQALEAGGESVELMLQALEDFHYDSLTITAAKDAAGETLLRFEILGKNPEVLEGYPFKFNINLSGNLNPILEALAAGYEISSDLIDRTWKLSQ